ncbi:unnamed protein product [Paramecium sonneborni]|uniref:Uncharacterized protein n=1 Tax=Paramecium sonneborni TaxID=65129 RepID=A0A8S1NCX2_9CILI|nr:unnamed protein product [Paramecium sonneborni]
MYRNELDLFIFSSSNRRIQILGSFNIHADIWVCIFNPEQDIFTTDSEDQNVKAFNFNQNQIVELTGYKLAVTFLDWKYSQNQLILYSDNRIYNNKVLCSIIQSHQSNQLIYFFKKRMVYFNLNECILESSCCGLSKWIFLLI